MCCARMNALQSNLSGNGLTNKLQQKVGGAPGHSLRQPKAHAPARDGPARTRRCPQGLQATQRRQHSFYTGTGTGRPPGACLQLEQQLEQSGYTTSLESQQRNRYAQASNALSGTTAHPILRSGALVPRAALQQGPGFALQQPSPVGVRTRKVVFCAYGNQALQVPQAQQAVVQAVPLRLVPQAPLRTSY